jgi:cytochrome P450
VIKEGLRIHPPVSGLKMVATPKRGDVILGIRVPEDTRIRVSVVAATQDKEIFGPDADVFRPELWFNTRRAGQKNECRRDIIFRAGKWQCLRKGLALMKINKDFVDVRNIIIPCVNELTADK